jgi:succinate dehydrogenase / fumarate reductase cytochrome b subunit
MNPGNRPLSPHLQVYKPQITSVLSILHRLTGIGLAVGAVVLVYWLNAAAYGPDAFEYAQGLLATWFGRLLLLGWTWALFYHLCNGIRHLYWDAGRGLELQQVHKTGWFVVVASLGFTLISWVAGYGLLGEI